MEQIKILEKERQELENTNEYYQTLIHQLQNRLNEYESIQGDETCETSEMQRERYGSSTSDVGLRSKAPRLFCDICDQFDLHDTEDCPLQSMGAKEIESHSRHNCDNCEEFGHDTDDAVCPNKNKNNDDDQMF